MTYLNEQNKKSSTRLIFVIGSFWNMAMTTYLGVVLKCEPGLLLAFFSGIEAVLIGLKLGQKGQEVKNNRNETR